MPRNLRCGYGRRLLAWVLLFLGQRLGRLLDVLAAVGALTQDQSLELLQQVLADGEVAGVLVLALQLQGVPLQVVELATAVRVLDEEVAPGPDRPVARSDDGAGDLGGVVLVEVLDVRAEVNATLGARGAHRGPGFIRGPRRPGLDQDGPE